MSGLEFYTASAKLELFLVADKTKKDKLVPILALTPAYENASKGKPQPGEKRFDYNKRLSIKLEYQDLAFLVDVLTAYVRAPKTIEQIMTFYRCRKQTLKNGDTVLEYITFRTVSNTQKNMTVSYNVNKNTLFLSVMQDNTRVSFPLHQIAGQLREVCTVLLHKSIESELIETARNPNSSKQATDTDEQTTQQTKSTSEDESAALL